MKSKNITINLNQEAQHWLAEAGFDEMYGARPLKRVIQQEILNPLSKRLLAGEILERAIVNITVSPKTKKLEFQIINETSPVETDKLD